MTMPWRHDLGDSVECLAGRTGPCSHGHRLDGIDLPSPATPKQAAAAECVNSNEWDCGERAARPGIRAWCPH